MDKYHLRGSVALADRAGLVRPPLADAAQEDADARGDAFLAASRRGLRCGGRAGRTRWHVRLPEGAKRWGRAAGPEVLAARRFAKGTGVMLAGVASARRRPSCLRRPPTYPAASLRFAKHQMALRRR